MGRYTRLDTTILKETREKHGHTHESLARAVGVARESYSRIESGGRTQVVTAEKIAVELGVNRAHLTGIKRGDTMFSPFACEFLCPVEAGGKSKRLLFDTELQLLKFIETYIRSERPMLYDNLFPEFSKQQVPAYSISPDGRSAELKLPRRDDGECSSDDFCRFIFRELEYRESEGYVWRKLTKWAQLTIEHRLQEVLNKYWPGYRFNGKRHGENTEFRITLSNGYEEKHSQIIVLQDFHMLILFSHWLSRALPKTSALVIDVSWGVKLMLTRSGAPMVTIAMCRVDRDGENLAPFPDQWKEDVLMQFKVKVEVKEAQEIGCAENKSLPDIEEFSELIPEIEARLKR